MPDDVDILIADDDLNILMALGYAFDEEGFSHVSARNGSEALDMLRLHRPRVAVLDVMFPEPDGYRVCREIRSDPDLENTHVVFLSALGQEHEVTEGYRSGADEYFTKPFSMLELIEHLKGVLGRGDG